MDISPLGENNFEGNINVDSLHLIAGDTLFYKVVATDIALTSNTTQAPASGWFYVVVSPLKTPVIRYGQTFDHSFSSSDFILDGFKIVTTIGSEKIVNSMVSKTAAIDHTKLALDNAYATTAKSITFTAVTGSGTKPAANSTNAVITFVQQAVIPFPVGSRITV